MVRILHIAESYGSGVASAINEFVNNTPENEHYLLFSKGRGTRRIPTWPPEDLFKEVFDLPVAGLSTLLNIEAKIGHVVDQVKPDYVHLHSSFAGVYGRWCAHRIHKSGAKIVYSPHCYAFERENISKVVRKIYRVIEKVFSKRTDIYAVCSLREYNLTQELLNQKSQIVSNTEALSEMTNNPNKILISKKSTLVVFVPNLPSIHCEEKKDVTKMGKYAKVVTVGRISLQKGYEMLPEISVELAQKRLQDIANLGDSDDETEIRNVKFKLLGDGTEEEREDFKKKGVRVSGWLDTKKLVKQMVNSDIYIHTAKWEGFPIAIKDAIEIGLPIIALNRPYLMSAPKEWLFKSKYDAADMIRDLVHSDELRRQCAYAWQEAYNGNDTPQAQKCALQEVYSA
ncbi:MAG: glycosyltransferase [Candidatus Ancillula sp.]|jgi:glycosyltransferase involved in cell wall biosynthesis|nr:glycosyltransferase [Candidatus Ancillula sp.]